MSKYNIQADSPQVALRLFVEQFMAQEPGIEAMAASGSSGGNAWRVRLTIIKGKGARFLRLVKKENKDG